HSSPSLPLLRGPQFLRGLRVTSEAFRTADQQSSTEAEPGAAPEQAGKLVRAVAAAALAGIALTPFALPLAAWAQAIVTEVLQGIGGAARSAWLTYLAGVLVV